MTDATALDLATTTTPVGRRDSGHVDVRTLTSVAPLCPVSALAPRAQTRRSPSLGGLAVALAIVASLASTAMASRALYLVRHGIARDPNVPALAVTAPAMREPESVHPTLAHHDRAAAPAPRDAVASAAAAARPVKERGSPGQATEPSPALRATRARPRASSDEPTPAPAPRPAAGAPSGGIDELMERFAAPTAEEPTAATAAAPALPEVPARADVSRALSALSSRVAACGDEGTAMVRFAFDGPTGRVRTAAVTGDLAGSPVAGCVERAVSDVILPPFERSPFVVTFPYRL